MNKNVNEVAVKGRQTKLGKKTYEELIQIILRKDKTERCNASTIKNLKAEVNDLKLSVEQLTKNVKEEANTCISRAETITKLEAKCKAANEKLERCGLRLESNAQIIKALVHKVDTYKGLCIFLGLALTISIIANILL